MYIVQIDSDAGVVQITCESLEMARAEEAKCLNKDAGQDENQRKYVEGVFDVKVFLACVNPEQRKDAEGQMADWWVECTSCGKCIKRNGKDRLERFKARYAKPTH